MDVQALLESKTPSKVSSDLRLMASDREEHSAGPTVTHGTIPTLRKLQEIKKATTKQRKKSNATDPSAKQRTATDTEAVQQMMDVCSCM
jgi:hypothetical protein